MTREEVRRREGARAARRSGRGRPGSWAGSSGPGPAIMGGPSMNGLWFAGLLPALLAAPDPAQEPRPAEGTPASTNIRGAEYPRIHDDLRVTFRIKAPDAQKVEFGFFDNRRYAATKGRGRLLDRDDGPRGAGLPLLPDVHRRRPGERPGEQDVLRHGQGHQRDRGPGEGRRLLPCPRTCRTARSASAGTSRRRPRTGGGSSSTRRPATTPIARRAIPSSTSSTGAARTRRAGRSRAAWASSSTT